tara:strand:+ start:410 stop:3748 length:3339 start_codon:yes stop_codon:yes gene_type:complete
MAMQTNYNSFLKTSIPGMYIEPTMPGSPGGNINIFPYNDFLHIESRFHTVLQLTSLRTIDFYLNGDFANYYKIAVFSDTNNHKLEGGYQERYKSLFKLAENENSGVILHKQMNMREFIRPHPHHRSAWAAPWRLRRKLGNLMSNYFNTIHENVKLIEIPFSVKFEVPVSTNLSMYIVPYTERKAHVPNTGVGNNMLTRPSIIGDVIEEKIIENDSLNLRRHKFVEASTGLTWPRPTAVHIYKGQFWSGQKRGNGVGKIHLRRETVQNHILYDYRVRNQILEKMDLTEEKKKSIKKKSFPFKKDKHVEETLNVGKYKKNYFSPMFLARDRNNDVRGMFGVDMLNILRSNFPFVEIFHDTSPSDLSSFVNRIRINQITVSERDLGHTSTSLSENKSLNVIAYLNKPSGTEPKGIHGAPYSPPPSQVLSARPTPIFSHPQTIARYNFIKHFVFKSTTNKQTFGVYSYKVDIDLDIIPLLRFIQSNERTLISLRNKLQRDVIIRNRALKAGYVDKYYKWRFNPHAAFKISDSLMELIKIWAWKNFTNAEYASMRKKIYSLQQSTHGAYYVVNIIRNLIMKLTNIQSSLKRGSTKKDTFSSGAVPGNLEAGGHKGIIRISKEFSSYNEIYDMRNNTDNYGVDYLDTEAFPTAYNRIGPIKYKNINKRFDHELAKMMGANSDPLGAPSPVEERSARQLDVKNMTLTKFNKSLDLNSQRYSYLSPVYIKTGAHEENQLMQDQDYQKGMVSFDLCNYYLLQYKIKEAIDKGKIASSGFAMEKYSMPQGYTGDLTREYLKRCWLLWKYFNVAKSADVLVPGHHVADEFAEPSLQSWPDENNSSIIPELLASEETDSSPGHFITKLKESKAFYLSALSAEIFNDNQAFNGLQKYYLPSLFESATYNQVSSLPNQIKFLLKNYDYVASKMKADYNNNSNDTISEVLRNNIINVFFPVVQQSPTEKPPGSPPAEEEANGAVPLAAAPIKMSSVPMKTAGYVYINYLNLKEIQSFEGYEIDSDGDLLITKPIFKKLTSLNRPGSIFCRLVDYKNLKFNIPETANFPVYNEHFFIQPSIEPRLHTLPSPAPAPPSGGTIAGAGTTPTGGGMTPAGAGTTPTGNGAY